VRLLARLLPTKRYLIVQRGRMEGFLVLDCMSRAAEAIGALAGWVQAGKLKDKVHAHHGLGTRRRRCAGCSRLATKEGSSCVSRSKTRRTSELASRAPLCAIICTSMSGMRRLRGTASLDAPHFRALDSKMSHFLGFRRVSGNGLGTAKWMAVDSAETNRRAALNFAMKRAR
jgi:hypothetical protein